VQFALLSSVRLMVAHKRSYHRLICSDDAILQTVGRRVEA
jgi:hypothetical protein